MEFSELLKKVRELELIANKNVHSSLSGDYITSIPGKGLQFHEARKYNPGESIRLIDWNMTARLGEPYVKVVLDEREREVIIALDISPSMYSGWQDKTKIEFALELSATIAVSAIKNRDRVGHILFTNRVVESLRPSSGRAQLFRCLKAFIESSETPTTDAGTDIRSVLHEIQKNRNKKYILFIISDFIDRDIPDDLKYLRAGHDINFLHIYDPLEYLSTDALMMPSFSPESFTDRGIIRLGETGSLEEMIEYLKNSADRYRISYESFSTTDHAGKKLRSFFHKKRRRVL
ncbi:MAG: DUF58 domain-containing protein [Leptospiraceae bacterium]|nr:DUF58 domain-containing protein [Leptospiraceae bacterium]MCP5513646.1 DUF58 domain-containing protein [Leptospiraceae bacterium]